MRTGRAKPPLILTEEEHDRLQSLAHRARSQTFPGSARTCGAGLRPRTR